VFIKLCGILAIISVLAILNSTSLADEAWSKTNAVDGHWSSDEQRWIDLATRYAKDEQLDTKSVIVESVEHSGKNVSVTFIVPHQYKAGEIIPPGPAFAYRIYFKDGSNKPPNIEIGN